MNNTSTQSVPIVGNVVNTYAQMREDTNQPKEFSEVEKESQQLADLFTTKGWQVLNRRIHERVAALDKMAGHIEDGDTVEIIGFKRLATMIAMGELEQITTSVAMAYKQKEQNDEEKHNEKDDE